MKIKEFLEKKILRKENCQSSEVQGSLMIAERFIERAKGNLEMQYFDVAFSLAYQSMFHSARALLFKNNFKERSHCALISALKEIYSANNNLKECLNTLDSYRISRHAIQYNGALCSEADAVESIKDAEKLFTIAEEIIETKP